MADRIEDLMEGGIYNVGTQNGYIHLGIYHSGLSLLKGSYLLIIFVPTRNIRYVICTYRENLQHLFTSKCSHTADNTNCSQIVK